MRENDSSRWSALVLLCSAQFMVVVDSAVVNIAIALVIRQHHVRTWACATPYRLRLLHHHPAQPETVEIPT